jgi:spore coat polysaccharide biosynthesis protein SpsF
MVSKERKIAGVVQARMGSTRLPGKSLAKVYKHFALLELVLLRVQRAKTLDMVILATSEEKNCDPLEKIARRLGVLTIRGNEADVLSRFVTAIELYQPRAVVRICADNPLISSEEIDKLVAFFEAGRFDYAANNTFECGLPDGLGCEIVASDTLVHVTGKIRKFDYREHVTSYITKHWEQFSMGWLNAEQKLRYPELKLDIDTTEDLEKMRRFCSGLAAKDAPYWNAYQIVDRAIEHDLFP